MLPGSVAMCLVCWILRLSAVLTVAGLWLGALLVDGALSSLTGHAADFLPFLPVGIQLLGLLGVGAAAAWGTALAAGLVLAIDSPGASPAVISTVAIAQAFIPLAAVRTFAHVAGIGRQLAGLRPLHLPLLAALVCTADALVLELARAWFDLGATHGARPDLFTTVVSGFGGTLVAIALVGLFVHTQRRRHGHPAA